MRPHLVKCIAKPVGQELGTLLPFPEDIHLTEEQIQQIQTLPELLDIHLNAVTTLLKNKLHSVGGLNHVNCNNLHYANDITNPEAAETS